MAIDQAIWAEAKVLFEGGKSLNQIEAATGINRTSVGKKAKKEGWEKGKNLQLILDDVRVHTEKSTLNLQEENFHNAEVDRLSKDTMMINALSRNNMKGLGVHIESGEMAVIEHKMAQETIDKASVTLGVNARFSNSGVTINNTNAQQNNHDSMTDKDLDSEIDRVLDRIAD